MLSNSPNLRASASLLLVLAFSVPAISQATRKTQAPDWVSKSNEHAKVLLNVIAKIQPEGAARLGIEGHDEQIVDFSPGFIERQKSAYAQAEVELKKRLGAEADPKVKQDLEILVKAANDNVKSLDLTQKYEVQYFSLPQTVFISMRSLLDDQVAASRRPAAVVRLRKYTGLEKGYKPIAEYATALVREGMKNPKLMMPAKAEVEKDLAQSQFFVDGIGQLMQKYGMKGYEEPYAKLKEQMTAWDKFIKTEVLPKSREDFKLPAELYAFRLDQIGVDIPPEQLISMAHAAFDEIQGQMKTVAAQVAKEKGFASSDYRDVIRELKKKQLVGEAILPHYKGRLKQIEDIVRAKQLVSLPAREAQIRLASEAESAAVPAPNMRPPRLKGNTGEMGEFILPLNVPDKSGKMQSFDDFTFEAASWTLTAHEARPGHEMQFASIVEAGVSDARTIFAFNSTNVEGWGLYSEWILQPFMPAEGQLISLQHRLMRAARAFLDPELQLGKITPEKALATLKDEVMLSDAMAKQEVERYTFRSPGQATSYFYGYTKLRELRSEVEKALGSKFDKRAFHDFVLAQGLLPPDLMRETVMSEFVQHTRRASN